MHFYFIFWELNCLVIFEILILLLVVKTTEVLPNAWDNYFCKRLVFYLGNELTKGDNKQADIIKSISKVSEVKYITTGNYYRTTHNVSFILGNNMVVVHHPKILFPFLSSISNICNVLSHWLESYLRRRRRATPYFFSTSCYLIRMT